MRVTDVCWPSSGCIEPLTGIRPENILYRNKDSGSGIVIADFGM